jgi:hypothetical protein
MSRMRLVAVSLVGFALLAVVLPGRAEPSQVSYSETLSSDSVYGGGFDFSLPPFDPSLGTLTGVDVAEWFSTVGTGLAQNSDPVWAALGWIEQSYSVIADPERASAIVAQVFLPPGPSSAPFSAGARDGGTAFGLGDVAGGSFHTWFGPTYYFIGRNFDYSMFYSPFSRDPLDYGLGVTTYTDTVTGTLQITYTYTPLADPPPVSDPPPPTVPEPSTAVGAGLAVLAGLGYGWKRRRRGG